MCWVFSRSAQSRAVACRCVVVLRKLNLRQSYATCQPPAPLPPPPSPPGLSLNSWHLWGSLAKSWLRAFCLQLCCIFQVIGHHCATPQMVTAAQGGSEAGEGGGYKTTSRCTFQVFWHIHIVSIWTRTLHMSILYREILMSSFVIPAMQRPGSLAARQPSGRAGG